jgi:hypothetical protein
VKEGERLAAGLEVVIAANRYRCSGVLGRGSFSEVWGGETVSAGGGATGLKHGQEIAIKDICCNSRAELQQALFEAGLLERLRGPELRIPAYLGHRVDKRQVPPQNGGGSGYRVRVAMTRAPGEPLDNFLKRPPPVGQDGPNAVRRGCALATQLLRQLGPTLERVSKQCWHRDVNSHNVLLSDAVDGGRLVHCGDPDETARRASFWLIDFGLAVDSNTWQKQWHYADVAGDCRYWGPSSFLMSFYGAEDTATRKDFCNQYRHRLDAVGLGLTAMEVLCATVLATSQSWGEDSLRGSWRKLFMAWEKYREEVTRWHTQIYHIFASGADVGPLYRQLAQERVVDRVMEHHARLRSLLRACVQRAEDSRIQRLLATLAELIDEKSSMGLAEAVEAIGGPEDRASAQAAAVSAGLTNVMGPPPAMVAAPQHPQPWGNAGGSVPSYTPVAVPMVVAGPAAGAVPMPGQQYVEVPASPWHLQMAAPLPSKESMSARQPSPMPWAFGGNTGKIKDDARPRTARPRYGGS